jgi:hypothetical protein
METIITGFNIWIIVKILTVIVLGMYVIFAFVITRQVKVMTNTLTLSFESVVKLLAFIHLLFSILVFITAITVL